MKKLLFSIVLLGFGITTYGQAGSSFGIKAGLNYNGNGDYFDSASQAFEDTESNVGYHVGIWGKIGSQLYVRPELIFTSTQSGYENGDLEIQKLDLPVLVGTKIVGPAHVFAGPSLQYLINTDFGDATIDDVADEFSVGFHLGVGVNLGKFGVDVRYERGFTENEISFINSNIIDVNDRVDTRPEQLILSFSLKL